MGLTQSLRAPSAAQRLPFEVAKLRSKVPSADTPVAGYTWHERKSGSSAFEFGAGRVVLEVAEADVLVLRGLQEAGAHPNLLPVLDLFRADKFVFMMTLHCTGGHLGDALAFRKKWISPKLQTLVRPGFEPAVALAWTAQLLSALRFLHERRVIHRSVRPESCLLDNPRIIESNLVLGNYSLSSRLFEDNVMMDRPEEPIKGSAAYTAPELKRQAMSSTDRPLEIKSDCWSAGCILFVTLTGRPAFNYSEFPVQAEKGKYVVPKYVPKDVTDFLATLLEVDYNKRADAASAYEAAQALAGRYQREEDDEEDPESPKSLGGVDLS